jgi:hypothetical protein
LIGAAATGLLAVGAAIYVVIYILTAPAQTVAVPQASLPPAAMSVPAAAPAPIPRTVAVSAAGEIVSPFTDVRWRGNVPEVQVKGTWYELMAVNNHPMDEIIAQAHKLSADRWRGAVADSIGEILQMLGEPATGSVKLRLQTLDTHEAVTLDDVVMTAENMKKIRPPPALGAAFSGVRWDGDMTQVQVNGRWYELVAIDDVPANQIIQYAKGVFADRWQKRVAEDLDTVMTGMNHPLGEAVNLQLRTLDAHEAVAINQSPLTAENRTSLIGQHGDFTAHP